MPYLYSTKKGDVLDAICWQHYGQDSQYSANGIPDSPQLTGGMADIVANHVQRLKMSTNQPHQMVEKVLEANPDLAAYGTIMPVNLVITLPDVERVVPSQSIKLWA